MPGVFTVTAIDADAVAACTRVPVALAVSAIAAVPLTAWTRCALPVAVIAMAALPDTPNMAFAVPVEVTTICAGLPKLVKLSSDVVIASSDDEKASNCSSVGALRKFATSRIARVFQSELSSEMSRVSIVPRHLADQDLDRRTSAMLSRRHRQVAAVDP